MFAILSVLLILAWRSGGWYGLDRFIFNDDWTVRRLRDDLGHAVHRRGHPRVPAVGTPHSSGAGQPTAIVFYPPERPSAAEPLIYYRISVFPKTPPSVKEQP